MNDSLPEYVQVAREWLGGAEENLRASELLFKSNDSLFRLSCFHSHLAVEKAFKALLSFRSVPFKKTHDLVGLYLLCPKADQGEFVEEELAALNPWTSEGRYPENLMEPSEAESERLVSLALRVVDSVRSVIGT